MPNVCQMPTHQARQARGATGYTLSLRAHDARMLAQAIGAPGAGTIEWGAPSQQPLLVCAPHLAAYPFPTSMTCQPLSHSQASAIVCSRSAQEEADHTVLLPLLPLRPQEREAWWTEAC